MILVSDSLEHDFKMLTGEYITPKGWECLDGTLFVYQNKPYLCFSNNWTSTITGDGDGSLFMAELKEDLTEMVGKPKKIISGKYSDCAIRLIRDDGVQGYIAEGPWLYEENSKIILLWPTIGKNGYMVIKSTSANGALGDYMFDSVVFDEDGGHCMRFTDLNEKSCITFHQPNQTPYERMYVYPLK